ncbi:MAG: CD225/dispanin family protein [Flavobacteriaceae bacterium]|jgi:hypothetical protein|nr:CD225/dispanin family protein [Flavobacteriaceae bacterium]
MENQDYGSSFQDKVNISNELPPVPNSNMPLAIISTVLTCCSCNCVGAILGIIAMVYAGQVNTKYIAQDYIGAENAAKNARILSFVALGMLVLGIILNIIYVMMVGVSTYISQYEEILRGVRY